MKKVIWSGAIVVILIGCFIYYMNNRLDESELQRFSETIVTNEEIAPYISFVTFSKDDDSIRKTNGFKFVDYTVSGDVTEEFISLSDQQKLSVLLGVIKTLKEQSKASGSDFNCGKNYICSFDSLFFSDVGATPMKTYQIDNVDISEDNINEYNMIIAYDENGEYNPKVVGN